MSPPGPEAREGSSSTSRRLAWALSPFVVLLVAAGLSLALLRTSPRAERKPPPRLARLVEVTAARIGTSTTRVEAMGTVRAAREIELRPRVSGEIVEASPRFLPGGRFERTEMLVRIDPADYELAVAQRRGELAEAEAALRLELGNQDVARKEFELLGEEVPEDERDLVLRAPQLKSAQARVTKAAAALRQARLDLERTTVRTPFPAVILRRGAELGSRVDPNTVLATLAGSDETWVEVSVPVRDLRWIRFPDGDDPGSAVRVFDEAAWGPEVSREGAVLRLLGDLEAEGRMARLLVTVAESPAETGDELAPLLLGSFVRVEIEGRTLGNVAALERGLLRDGDRVWILTPEDRLEIRPVRVAFRGRDTVLVSDGLRDGERIVRTELSAPVEGMPLRPGAPEAEDADGG